MAKKTTATAEAEFAEEAEVEELDPEDARRHDRGGGLLFLGYTALKDVGKKGGGIFPNVRTNIVLHSFKPAEGERSAVGIVEEQPVAHLLAIQIGRVDE